jgi:hypothetical protein
MRDGNDAHETSCRYHSNNILAPLEWDEEEEEELMAEDEVMVMVEEEEVGMLVRVEEA